MEQGKRTSRLSRGVTVPECLGQIAENYSKHCSDVCPKSALCVLMVMWPYLRRHPETDSAS